MATLSASSTAPKASNSTALIFFKCSSSHIKYRQYGSLAWNKISVNHPLTPSTL
ncbi:uncharacterized protein DS421_5g140460 [Arachis hypogaea]|nr:uncharacterized protein DS421_5g140460 [Arachis hypogaea]